MANYNGTDSFSYKANDGSLDSNVATVTLEIVATAAPIMGDAGPNTLTGTAGHDVIYGLAGDDTISGLDGNDTIVGGTNADRLNGGPGDDTYLFARGDGWDTILEDDATAGNTDVVQFMAGIAIDQLWFNRAGNDLEVTVIGTGEGMTLQNWYTGSRYQVEQFKSGDGKTLNSTSVQRLVNAMAGYAKPRAGQMMLPAGYASALGSTIQSSWV